MYIMLFSLHWLTVIGVAAAAAWVEHWLADRQAVAETSLHPATALLASAT